MYQCFVRNEYEMAQGIAELRLGGKTFCFAFQILMYTSISTFLSVGDKRNRVLGIRKSREIKFN